MKRFIGKLLIIIGVLTIGVVVYINYKTAKINEQFVNEYKNVSQNVTSKKDNYEIGDVIGILNIPKIDLEVAIKRGVTNEVLNDAVGHFENTPMPYENGNFSLAGHSAYVSNKFFSKLDKLDLGDEIDVLLNNKVFKYKVNSIDVVTPDKIDVVESSDKSKKEITLVTCTPKYVGSHRLIVKGEFVESR